MVVQVRCHIDRNQEMNAFWKNVQGEAFTII